MNWLIILWLNKCNQDHLILFSREKEFKFTDVVTKIASVNSVNAHPWDTICAHTLERNPSNANIAVGNLPRKEIWLIMRDDIPKLGKLFYR